MELEIKGVHLALHDDTREFITDKLAKLEFASDYVVDLQFTLTKENTVYLAEVKLHLSWGHSSVIKVHSYDLHEGVNLLIDKLDSKIRKERDKVTAHK